MNGTDTFLDINNAHLRVNSGNVQASTFVLDQINIVTSANTNSTVNFNNVTKAFNAVSNIEVGTANLFVDTTTSNVGIGTDAPLDTLHINGGTRISGHILPTVNDTYDLGSAEYKIRHLFLGNTSLWLGDETRITFTGGKMKFRRRKKNALPRGLATIAANRGHTSEQQTTTAALAHAGVATIEDMKLEHWIDYTKTLDETKEINDIFTEDANDYEATTASEAFKEIGEDSIYSPHSVSIGTTEAPNYTLDVAGDINFTGTLRKGGAEFSGSAWTETGLDAYRSSGNVGIGKTPDAGKTLDVAGTVKATAFEGDGSALTGITSGQWTYTAGTNSGTQQLVFDDQAPGTTFTGTLSGNSNNTAIRDTSNRYIRVTQGGTSRVGSVYWQTTLTNNWEATFEIYILPINYGGADDMRFIFYATNPITSNDSATGTNGHGGAYMRWEYYESDYVELWDHTNTRVWQQSASLQMNGWMPVTVTFNNGQLTSTIKNTSGTTLKTTTYDFGTTYSDRYNTPTYVAVTGRSGGVQAEDRVRNITINALNVPTGHKLTRMNANVGIDVANPTQKLDVAGTVKATAFEGDGSALTGITSGQWTESGGNIYRSSGNVGIGTTSADTKLHLYATGSGNILDFKMSGSWSAGDYYRIIGYNTAKQIQFNYNDGMWLSDNNSIRFGCGGTQGTSGLYSERMRITNAGDVGIGKTPDSGKKLDVNGTVKATAFEGDGSALTGISASGGGETVVEVNINAPNTTSGTWYTGAVSGTSSWGPPKFNSTYTQYAYTDGTTAYRQWNIPTNMKSAYVSQLQWSSGGYADVHGVRSDGALVFLRRINTFQNIENSSHSGDHDGSTITFIGSGLQYFTSIRISNRLGRLHLTGLAFTDKNNDGAEGTGMVHSKQISDFGSHRPLWRASYTSTNGYRNVGTVPFNRAEINQRNGYSTSTGLFTAPEAGHYWVYAQMYSNSSSGKDEICFIINGSASIYRDGMAFAVKGDTIPHFVSMPLMTTLWLNVNDTIGVYVRDAYAHYNSTGVAYFGGYRLA